MIIWRLRNLFLKEVHHGTRLWPRLYHLVMKVGQAFRLIDVSYQPHIIVLVFFWAALHERPVKWACNPRHWSTTTLRPGRLPSPSTMSRRLRRVDTAMLMRALVERLRQGEDPRLIALIDGKPLPVGGAGHDPEVRVAAGPGCGPKATNSTPSGALGRCPRRTVCIQ